MVRSCRDRASRNRTWRSPHGWPGSPGCTGRRPPRSAPPRRRRSRWSCSSRSRRRAPPPRGNGPDARRPSRTAASAIGHSRPQKSCPSKKTGLSAFSGKGTFSIRKAVDGGVPDDDRPGPAVDHPEELADIPAPGRQAVLRFDGQPREIPLPLEADPQEVRRGPHDRSRGEIARAAGNVRPPISRRSSKGAAAMSKDLPVSLFVRRRRSDPSV